MIDLTSVRVLPDGRVTRAEAAKFLGFSIKTLAQWAWEGRGPRPRRVGGRVFYRLEDLQAFRDRGVREAT